MTGEFFIAIMSPATTDILRPLTPRERWKIEYRTQRVVKGGILVDVRAEAKGALGTLQGFVFKE